MELFNSIGKRLREVRKGMGLSQSDFAGIAERAGVPGATRQSQARYEKGEQMPSAAYLAAIAQAKADVLYILTGQDVVSKQQPEPLTEDGIAAIVNYKRQRAADQLTSEEAEIIENYRQANADGQEAIQKTSAAVGRKSAVVVGGTPAKKRAGPTIVGGEAPKQRPGPTVTGETPKRERKKETGGT